MKQATKQKTDKKIVIEHLFKAIATMRSQQGPNSAKGQVQRVVEILRTRLRRFRPGQPTQDHRSP